MRSPERGIVRSVLFLLSLAVLPGCGLLDREPLLLPTAEEARTHYETFPDLVEVRLNGNVVEVVFAQAPAQLRRGGSLWAKVGPYIYLFTPGTRDLFEAYPGVAAVRTITTAGNGGQEAARAMLRRDDSNDILWRRSLNLLGHALQRGTQEPKRLEELVTWGERHTEFVYNPAYVPR